MPVVFLFSAIVSGIALVMLLYMVLSRLRRVAIDMACLDTIARYLLYAFLIDFSLEMLDLDSSALRGRRVASGRSTSW